MWKKRNMKCVLIFHTYQTLDLSLPNECMSSLSAWKGADILVPIWRIIDLRVLSDIYRTERTKKYIKISGLLLRTLQCTDGKGDGKDPLSIFCLQFLYINQKKTYLYPYSCVRQQNVLCNVTVLDSVEQSSRWPLWGCRMIRRPLVRSCWAGISSSFAASRKQSQT